MKIGFFTDSYLPSHDGVATSVSSSAAELIKLGHQVSIIAPRQNAIKDKKNVYRLLSIRLFKNPEIFSALSIPQPIYFKLLTLRFDIIHGHSGGPVTFLGWQLAKLFNVPFVATYHTKWRYYLHYFPLRFALKPWMFEKLSAFLANLCTAIIAPTENVKTELLSYGVKKPIVVIPSGIYIENFAHVPKNFLKERLAIPQDKKILLTVGRLEEEKSPDFLIQAFLTIYRLDKNVVLVFVGEGREKTKLQKLAIKYAIQDAIYFAGTFDYEEMPKVYADGTIFLFASTTETQGLVITEALASGLPVVAVKDAVYTHIIEEGFNGFTTKKDNEQFAKKVCLLLEDKELRTRLGENAKKSAQQFSVHTCVKLLESMYQNISENKK
jgi:1,2-diacylglycerol 3-alpha-glucosyltransferase